jgi:hypothetical protein
MSLHDPHAGRRAYAPSMFDDLPSAETPIPDPPAVHVGDPDTSLDALNEHEASGRRDLHKMIVMGLVLRYPLKTACELFELTTPDERTELKEMQEVRRRLVDLAATGLVHQRDPRVCAVRGTKMVVWEAVKPLPAARAGRAGDHP